MERIKGITKGEKRKKGTESYFKQITKRTSPNYGKDWNFTSKKLIEHIIISIQKKKKGFIQGTLY